MIKIIKESSLEKSENENIKVICDELSDALVNSKTIKELDLDAYVYDFATYFLENRVDEYEHFNDNYWEFYAFVLDDILKEDRYKKANMSVFFDDTVLGLYNELKEVAGEKAYWLLFEIFSELMEEKTLEMKEDIDKEIREQETEDRKTDFYEDPYEGDHI